MNFKKKRPKTQRITIWFIGMLLMSALFLLSIYVLSDTTQYPKMEDSQAEEAAKKEFVQQIAPYAQELQATYGVLPSIIIGQAILESNWGQSLLASEYKNLFGVKAYGDQRKVALETQEYVNEEWITIQGEFRAYDSWEESMDDHTQLFLNGVNWNPELYVNVLTAQNYQEAAQALQDAGYATDPTYAEKVIAVIESYGLAQYDE